MTNSTTPNTTTSDDNWGALWREYWAQVRNEDWLTARRLLDLSPRVRGFFACHLAEQHPHLRRRRPRTAPTAARRRPRLGSRGRPHRG